MKRLLIAGFALPLFALPALAQTTSSNPPPATGAPGSSKRCSDDGRRDVFVEHALIERVEFRGANASIHRE